ncbi:MAG: hypothetical protein Q4C29_01680 [bacterium]|nr:hypothetical protein [bacterium]
MDYLKFVADYYWGTRVFAEFLLNNLYSSGKDDFINSDKWLYAAKMGAISNIFLSIKDDIVQNNGKSNYDSKLCNGSLEKCVSIVSKKVSSGYMIDNYVFKDASSLVAVLRNKIAHGEFYCDFDKKKVILFVSDDEVSIDIDLLSVFIIKSLSSSFLYAKTKEFSRNLTVCKCLNSSFSKKLVSDDEIIEIIKGCTNIKFDLSRSDGKELEKYEIDAFNSNLNRIRDRDLDFELIQELKNNYRSSGYNLEVQFSSIKKYSDIMEVVALTKNTILYQKEYSYDDEVKAIVNEVQRKINSFYNKFNPLSANLINLSLIDEIYNSGSVDFKFLVNSLGESYGRDFFINYDNVVTSLIAVFNSIFSTPLDGLYKNGDSEASVSGIDFSKFDFSSFNVLIDNHNDGVFADIDVRLSSLNRDLLKLMASYKSRLNDYYNVLSNGNTKAVLVLKKVLVKLCDDMNLVRNEIGDVEAKLKYYKDNELYIKNKSILEGIRNSIYHGNYEVLQGVSFSDTKLVFSDIYEGDLTFKLEATVTDFLKFFDANFKVLDEYFETVQDGYNRSV